MANYVIRKAEARDLEAVNNLLRQESGSLMPVKTLYLDDLCVDQKARGQRIGKTPQWN